jgi:hypothetical protein
MAGLPVQPVDGGILLAVRLAPRAGRDAADRIVHDAEGRPLLQLRIAAPAVDGAANAALIAFVAKALRVRKADVAIRSGQASRIKRLAVAGDPDALIRAVAALIA